MKATILMKNLDRNFSNRKMVMTVQADEMIQKQQLYDDCYNTAYYKNVSENGEGGLIKSNRK